MNCLGVPDSNGESSKNRKLKFSPRLRKRKSDKGAHGVTMATSSDSHLHNGFTDTERTEMKSAFDMFDKNNDGKISCEELGLVLRTLGHNYTQPEVEDMIKLADINENGFVEYDEFLALMKRWSCNTPNSEEDPAPLSEEDRTKETFKVFDMDGNGYIDRHELRFIMKRLGENLGEEDVKEMFRLADLNGDGLIDYDEFSKLLGGLETRLGDTKSSSGASTSTSTSSSSSSSKHTPKSSKASKDGKKK